MAQRKYLNETGLSYFWGKIKTYVTNAVKVTGVKGNAESSYRTGNVNITADNVNAITKSQSGNTQFLVRPSYLNGLGDNTLDQKINTLRANRLAFLPADQIIIEKTTDGGATWVDAGVSDATKVGLFSETRAGVSIPLLNGVKSLQCGLRITITAMKYNVPAGTAETQKYNYWNSNYVVSAERYNQVKEMYFWVSTNSDTVNVKVERATGANSTSWATIFNNPTWGMTGWSGNDYIRFSQGVFGGGTNQTGNYWNYRLTFMTRGVGGGETMATSYTTSSQGIYEIRAYGDTWWTAGNNYAANDHIYSHDYQKNVTFPAQITATQFNGNATGLTTFLSQYNTAVNANNVDTNGHLYYTSNGPTTSLGATTNDGALYTQRYSSAWQAQIAQDYRNGRLFVRGKNAGSWTAWRRIAQYEEVPTSAASHTTGISIANHGTTNITGVSGSVTGSHVKSGGNGTAPTLGTAFTVPNVTAKGSGSFTQGAFSGGSFTQGTDSFTQNTPTVIDTSKFSGGSFTRGTFSGGSGSFTQGSFSGGSFTQGTDSFTANTPTVINTSKFSGGSFTRGSFSGGSGSFTSGAFSGGSGSFSATVSNHVMSFSHTHTAATHAADSHTHTAATHAADSFTAASLQSGFYTAGTAASFTQGTDSFTPATHGNDSHTHTAATHAADTFTAAKLNNGFYTAGTKATFTQGTDSFTPATHGSDSHTHTAPTLGTAFTIPNVTSVGSASNWVFEDVTVPKAASATTVVTGASHTITDNGHTHTLS